MFLFLRIFKYFLIFTSVFLLGPPQCSKCLSNKFRALHVSADFLQKLKQKPGIGRSRRYISYNFMPSQSGDSDVEDLSSVQNAVTLEQIFQLPKQQLQYLFDHAKDKREKLKGTGNSAMLNVNFPLKGELRDQEISKYYESQTESKIWLTKNSKMTLKKNCSSSSLFSKKPLNCPHDPCQKIIAISSFFTHFKHEHPDIIRYTIERGKELTLVLDMTKIEHNNTICLGLVTVYDVNKISLNQNSVLLLNTVSKKFNQKIPIDTFWIMVSGSPEEKQSRAYVLFWLFSNNEDYYNCTIEASSEKDHISYSTFCGVNDMHDSQNIIEIAQRLNCLYLSYGSVLTMLNYGPNIQLRVTIH